MVVLKTSGEMKAWRKKIHQSVGFVPTMGALHSGHRKLIQASKNEREKTVLSIFVNPLQFNNQADFTNYPQTLERDLEVAQACDVDVVFLPEKSQIYPTKDPITLSEKEISSVMEGPFRPGHFEGVLTVVLKLFNLVQPTHAYFGKKDYQQYLLIEKMAKDLFLDTEIIGVETVRDEMGLALSSRNSRLNSAEIHQAQKINKILKNSLNSSQAKKELEEIGFKVDYVEDLWGRRFTALYLGEVRLIDNVNL